MKNRLEQDQSVITALRTQNNGHFLGKKGVGAFQVVMEPGQMGYVPCLKD